MITDNEKKLMNEIQYNLRKEDNLLAKHFYNDDFSGNEKLLATELQRIIRRADNIFNYFLNSSIISEQQKDKIISHLLECDIVDYLLSDKQTKKVISYENSVPMPAPVPVPAPEPVSVPVPAPATTPHSKLESIFLEEISLELFVTRLLVEVGIPASINGFGFIRTGLILLLENNVERIYITKNLYPEIAKKHKTTSTSVERCTRHAIEVAWERGNAKVFDELFGYSISSNKGKPTNSEFMFTISDYIRLHR